MKKVGYYARKFKGQAPNTEGIAEQERLAQANRVHQEAFRYQTMPDAEVKGGQIYCPFAGCGRRQKDVCQNPHTCESNNCGRQFKVPFTKPPQRDNMDYW